jgi:hypothetical protein
MLFCKVRGLNKFLFDLIPLRILSCSILFGKSMVRGSSGTFYSPARGENDDLNRKLFDIVYRKLLQKKWGQKESVRSKNSFNDGQE